MRGHQAAYNSETNVPNQHANTTEVNANLFAKEFHKASNKSSDCIADIALSQETTLPRFSPMILKLWFRKEEIPKSRASGPDLIRRLLISYHSLFFIENVGDCIASFGTDFQSELHEG